MTEDLTYLSGGLATGSERPLWPALRRGFQGRCPECGQGAILYNYLKVHDCCAACGEDFTAQRADDGPTYLTILIVGHILAPLLYFVYSTYRPQPWTLATIFCTLTVALALFLLPRIKGAFIALQWAKRMHGFGTGEPDHS